MTTIAVHAVMLSCDGCGTRLRDGQQFSSAAEARGAAYTDGWQFPPQISKRTGRVLSTTSDACPDCAPNWTAQTLGSTPPGYQTRDGVVRPTA
jgi:hypothetical protein